MRADQILERLIASVVAAAAQSRGAHTCMFEYKGVASPSSCAACALVVAHVAALEARHDWDRTRLGVVTP